MQIQEEHREKDLDYDQDIKPDFGLNSDITLYGKNFYCMSRYKAYTVAATLAFVLCGALSVGEDVHWGMNFSLGITYQNYPLILFKSLLKVPINLGFVLLAFVYVIPKVRFITDLIFFLVIALSILAIASAAIATYLFRRRAYFSAILLFVTLLTLFVGAIYLNAAMNQFRRFG